MLLRPFVVAIAAALAVAACFWYVTAPPKGADGYRERAASMLDTVRARTESARIAVRTLDEDKATRSFTLVMLRQSEHDAAEALSDFTDHEPPSGSEELRKRLSEAGNAAVDALRELRIAAEQVAARR